jgi:hypothetical protein
MQISIFPEAESHPKSKEGKIAASKVVSAPNLPQLITVNSSDELIEAITSFAWSPFVYSKFRHGDFFVSCDVLVYDFDEGTTIDEAEAIIEQHKLCALCLPTPNHKPEEGVNKFRLLLPLSHTIYDKEQYSNTWLKGAELFPLVDQQCKGHAQWFTASTKTDGFWIEGELFSPVKKAFVPKIDTNSRLKSHTNNVPVSLELSELVQRVYGKPREKIPEAVAKFFKEAPTGMKGEWICSLNSCCFSLSLSGVEDSVIVEVIEDLAPSPLDSKDRYQIQRALRDGKFHRDNEL